MERPSRIIDRARGWTRPYNRDGVALADYILHLEAENAALRSELDGRDARKAVTA